MNTEASNGAQYVDLNALDGAVLSTSLHVIRSPEVLLARVRLAKNPGAVLKTSQLLVAVHDGAGGVITWRRNAGHGLRRAWMASGVTHLVPDNEESYWQWLSEPSLTMMSVAKPLVAATLFDDRTRDVPSPGFHVGMSDKVIERMAEQWRIELTRRGLGGRVYLEDMAVRLIQHLYQAYGEGGKSLLRAGSGLSWHKFRRVAEYVDANLYEDIGLQQMAESGGIELHCFSAAFMRTVGMPPHRYLTERRVERARTMLRESADEIAAIALAVGFRSQSQMASHFRRITGITPAAHRRAARINATRIRQQEAVSNAG